MKKQKNKESSKGASIFKKMLEDKKAIQKHLQKGGKFAELKKRFKFVAPIPSIEK